MLHTYKTEGIILKRKNFSEADKFLTVFTPDKGKIVVIAKGIRRIKSRKSAHCEVFNHVSMFLAIGRNTDVVTEAKTIDSFPVLRSHIDRIAYCYRMIEVVNLLCAEHQEHPYIYQQLLTALHKLNNDYDVAGDEIVDQFLLEILWDLGFLPYEKKLSGIMLKRYIEEVTERILKSDSLLTKVSVNL